MHSLSTTRNNSAESSNSRRTPHVSLRELHLTDDEERVYRRLLLSVAGLSVSQLREHTGLDGSRLTDAVAGLENRDLVHRRGHNAEVIVVHPPERAFADLLAEHERHLAAARRRIENLSRLYDSRATYSADVVDVIVGKESIVRHFHHMQRQARTQIRGCDRPPYTEIYEDIRPVQREQVAAGVEYRILYDPVVLALPSGVERMRRATEGGEQVRLLAQLPVKLGIADDTLAMIALGRPGGEASALLVHPSELLDSLIAVFDTLWRFATPLRSWTDDSASGFSEKDRELLSLLAAGVTEETMARRLGIGLRTVQRRIQLLTETLGATTRFQAGVAAAKRGLL